MTSDLILTFSFTFMLRTVQVFDATRLQLIAECGLPDLLEKAMVQQLVYAWSFDRKAIAHHRYVYWVSKEYEIKAKY